MVRKIQVLPEAIAQTIAAGEVVERPASVVKELVENSIDAGSSKVVVELKAGGTQLIRVEDDGEGIAAEDVPLALQRYATSKIRTKEDLYNIRTLGFRGEALPSIASVSRLTIKTRVGTSLSGTQVVCDGGEIRSVSDVGCPVGTEVSVRELFYNLPVKRKFLKSIRSELHQVLSHFLKVSLSHPAIAFKFIHDDRVLYDLVRTEDPSVRIEAILGRETYHHLQMIEWVDGEIKISGYGGLPSVTKGSAEGISLYVNRRYVKDRLIVKALMEAYRHVIPTGKFPVVLLWMEIPPYAVDVNVHPTKAEVKFRDSERIFQAVRRALAAFLEPTPSAAEGAVKGAESSWVRSEGVGVPPAFRPFSPGSLLVEPKGEPSVPVVKEGPTMEWKAEKGFSRRVLGQIHGTFILCEGEQGLVIVDQHAAHERILFEQYKTQYEVRSLPVVKFLIPPVLEVSAEESFVLSSTLEEFQAIGFEMDPVGEKIYAIRSAPAMVGQERPQELIKSMLEDVVFHRKDEKGAQILETLLTSLACHTALKGNVILKKEEMDSLVERLTPFRSSATCPHGRPIFFVIPRDELNKQFKRKEGASEDRKE